MPYISLPSTVGNILCYSVSGVVTAEDYTEKLIPDVERVSDEYGKARILIDIADFHVKDMNWAAMWENPRFGMRMGKIEKFALICKHDKIAYALKPFLVGVDYKPFHMYERDRAFQWIFCGSAFMNPVAQMKANYPIPFLHTSKFLLAIGNDEATKAAIAQAMHLLRADGTDEELHLITVITSEEDTNPLTREISAAADLIESVIGPRTEDTEKLKVLQHIVEARGKTVADVVLEVATAIAADYIIIGTEKTEGMCSLPSSVCMDVIRRSTCPVVVCKPTTPHPQEVNPFL